MLLEEDFKNIVIKGFPTIKWHHVFSRIIIESEFNPIGRLFIHRVLLRCFVSKGKSVQLKTDNETPYICFTENDRKSGVDKFDKFCSLRPMDYIKVSSLDKVDFHVCIGLRICCNYLYSWIRELNHSKMNRNERLFILTFLIDFFIFITKYPINFKKYKLLVVYYDASTPDSFMVELFRYHKILTATLQHGQFTAFRENKLENSGIEFRAHYSDFFLCWNKFTLIEAQKQGVEINNFICTGILNYIGEKYKEIGQSTTGFFGVVINHPFWEKDNLKLIQAANILSEKKKMYYYLKLHPNYPDDYFKKYTNSFYIANVDKNIEIAKYAEMVDFSIVGSSSVFVELVYIKHKTLRHSDKSNMDKYRDVLTDVTFNDPENIIDSFNQMNEKGFSNETFDLLCTVEDVTKEYTNFLSFYSDDRE